MKFFLDTPNLEQNRNIFNMYGFQTQVLAVSLRTTLHIVKCMEIVADVVTCSLKPIFGLLNHPLTDAGLKQFLGDHNKAKG